MYRRGQVCRAANHRYLEALASVTGSNSLLQEAAEVCRPVTRNGKRYRGLNALAQKDHALLLALSRGEFALTSIRNADLRALLITVLIASCNADVDNLLKWPHENLR